MGHQCLMNFFASPKCTNWLPVFCIDLYTVHCKNTLKVGLNCVLWRSASDIFDKTRLFQLYKHQIDVIFLLQCLHNEKMCRVSARRLSIYNFAWELLKATNLQAESKILKYWNIKSTNQNENFPKKSMFSTLKV
jgi:hypothetical protein